MMEGYKKYKEYAETGADVLQNAPSHWKVLKGQFIFKVINERSKTGKELLLSVSEKKGVTPRSEANVTMFMAESYVGYKLCKPGDLVINSLWAWSYGLGFSEYNGIVSTAYSVYRPNHNKFNYRFLHYLLKTKLYVDQFRIYSKGIWTSRLQLHDWTFLRIPIVFPEKDEQTAIANFLDHKTTQIDNFIQTKEKTIALLKERKAAIINQAVTKGLNPNVSMKDSGIEWLGDIPEHWEIVPLKFLGKIKYGLGQPPRIKADGLPLIRATNVERGKINIKNLIFVDPDDIPYERDPVLRENDIIVVRSGAYTADSAIIPKEFEGAITGYDMVIRARSIHAQYLAFALLSNYILQNQLFLKRSRAAQPHLNAEELGEAFIIVPSEKEQNQISEYLLSKEKETDSLIKINKKEITLIKEYRESLISAAVTGKIDVRDYQIKQQEEHTEIIEH